MILSLPGRHWGALLGRLFSRLLGPGPTFYQDEYFPVLSKLNMPKETSRTSHPSRVSFLGNVEHLKHQACVPSVFGGIREKCCAGAAQGRRELQGGDGKVLS